MSFTNVIGDCPRCHKGKISDKGATFGCSNSECDFTISKKSIADLLIKDTIDAMDNTLEQIQTINKNEIKRSRLIFLTISLLVVCAFIAFLFFKP